MLWETPLMGCGVEVMNDDKASAGPQKFLAAEKIPRRVSPWSFSKHQTHAITTEGSVQNLSNAPPSK